MRKRYKKNWQPSLYTKKFKKVIFSEMQKTGLTETQTNRKGKEV